MPARHRRLRRRPDPSLADPALRIHRDCRGASFGAVANQATRFFERPRSPGRGPLMDESQPSYPLFFLSGRFVVMFGPVVADPYSVAF